MIGIITKEQCNKNKQHVFILNSFVGIQAGGREQMICSKWKVEMFAKGLKMVYVSLTYRNINSISLILLLLVFHFGSHPLIIFFSFLHNHDWQDLFPGDCMSWPLLTLVSGPGCDASWLAEALLGRHSVSDTGPHQFCYCNFLILPWVTYGGRQVHRYCNGLGSFVENLVSYVFLVLLCLHTHCRPLDHLQGKTGLILCRFLSTTVLNNWLFEVSALPLSIYSSTLLTRSKGGLALTVLLEHVLDFLLGKPFFLVFGT